MKTKLFLALFIPSFFLCFNLHAKFTVRLVYKKVTFCNDTNPIKIDQVLASAETANTLSLTFRETNAFVEVFDSRFKKSGNTKVWKLKLRSSSYKDKCITIKINSDGSKTINPFNSVTITDLDYHSQKLMIDPENRERPNIVQPQEGQKKNEPDDLDLSWEMVLLPKNNNC
jgi:hypothetical protein